MNENKVLVIDGGHVDYPGHSEEVGRIARLCAGANVRILRSREQEMMDNLAALKEQISDEAMTKEFIYTMATGMMGVAGFPFKKERPKPMTQCGLPGCKVMSVKDYCCADHCRQHRKMRKV